MIPVKLSVKGLYSYQSLQEVNFQPLIGASVFGIFGKVGSGKSSLLEAISFVLYGETDRLNGRDNRSYNMMNLKSGHLLIDFEFRAGADQQLYKFVYEARRHPKKHHEIALTERRSFRWEADNWLPLGMEKDDIATLTRSILGLDYDNFKRTIIIPQNQFREFLELNPKDRTEMMSRMFRLEKYDLAGRVTRLEKANDAALNVVKGQLEGVETASPEAIDTARQAVDAVLAAISGKEREGTELATREKHLADLQQRHQARADADAELTKLRAEQPVYKQIRARLDQYEACQRLFSVLFGQVGRVIQQQQELTKKLAESGQRLATATQRLPHLQQEYQNALAAFENRDTLQNQINELDEVRFIQGNQYSIVQQTRTRNTLQNEIVQQETAINQLKAERTQHQALVAQIGYGPSSLERLYAIQHWFTEYRPLKKSVVDFDRVLQRNEDAIQDIKQRKDAALVNFSEWFDLPLKELPDTIQAALVEAEKRADDWKAIYDNHLLRQRLHQYATALIDGKPCPLCGSEHHPAISHDATILDDVAASKMALAGADGQIRSMNTLLSTVNGLLGEIKTVHGQGRTLLNDRADAVARQTAHEDRFVWPDLTMDQETQVSNAIQRENAEQEKRRKARQAIDSLDQQLDTLEPKKAATEAEIANLNGQLESLTQTVAQRLEKLIYYKSADLVTLTPQRLNDLTDTLTAQFDQVRDAFMQAEQAKSAVEGEQTKYQTEVAGFAGQRNERQNERDELDATIADTLTHYGYTRPQVDTILAMNLDVVGHREQIRAFEQKMHTVQEQLNALTTELANQPFDSDELQRVRIELGQVQNESNRLNQQLGENRKIYSELVAQWARKQAIQEQFEQLTLRRKDLTDMAGLFRAQGFVNYVSSVYLQNLCEAANERFARLTNNHLKLEIDDKNNFLVRDHLNGGQTRLAKTLSGGQLFQASLSLALALSDNIQHLTKSKQNLFFLDEGFGSLDKDSLQTVFKTLQALRHENRIVGIISHVEELQHEIETFIRTEHTDNGSRITKSWE